MRPDTDLAATLGSGRRDAARTLQRAEVRADAVRHVPAAGEQNAQAAPVQPSAVTRAEVRAATRDAIAHGFRVASGENA